MAEKIDYHTKEPGLNWSQRIRERQKDFQRLVGLWDPDNPQLTDADRFRLSEAYLVKAAEEIFEVMRTMPSYLNQAQKNRPVFSRKRTLEEFSDVILFLVNFALVWDIRLSELVDIIEAVQDNNFDKRAARLAAEQEEQR